VGVVSAVAVPTASILLAKQAAESKAKETAIITTREDLSTYMRELKAELAIARADVAASRTELQGVSSACKVEIEALKAQVLTLETQLITFKALQTENESLRARNAMITDRLVDQLVENRIATQATAMTPIVTAANEAAAAEAGTPMVVKATGTSEPH
jgi:hypothetical protein